MSRERICGVCSRPFTVTPEPDGEWPHCLAPDCASYDPELDAEHRFGGPEPMKVGRA